VIANTPPTIPVSPAKRIAVGRFIGKDQLDVVRIGMDRHVILGEVGIHDAVEPVVDEQTECEPGDQRVGRSRVSPSHFFTSRHPRYDSSKFKILPMGCP